MQTKMVFIWAGCLLVLFNTAVWQKERFLDEGQRVILKLAPVDPRSLMQGDYMRLNYQIIGQMWDFPREDGQLVLRNNAEGVAELVGRFNGAPLPADCYLLDFSFRNEGFYLGAESFFFQEGHGSYYAEAAYGELVVDGRGRSVLIGLLDQNLKAMDKPK